MKLEQVWQTKINRYRRKLFAAIWLMEQCRYGAAALLLAGGIILLLRLFLLEKLLLPCVAGIALAAFFAAFFRAFRKLPSREKLFHYLCSSFEGGGVVLSAFECTNSFSEKFPLPPDFPKLKYLTLRRDLGALLGGMCFCAGMFFLPLQRETLPQKPQALDLTGEKEKLALALDAMKKMGAKAEEKALPLEKELEEAIRNADPHAPGRTYELLQALNKRINHDLAVENAAQTKLLRQLESLQQSAGILSREGLKNDEAARQFSELLQKLAKENPALAEALKKGSFNGANLGKKELSQLAKELKTDVEKLKRSLENLQQFCENSTPEKKEDSSARSLQELEEFLKENVPGCDDLIESLTNRENNGAPGEGMDRGGEGDEPGSGGVSRGRGDAVLEFSGHTPDFGAKMVDRKMRSSLPGEKKNSTALGTFTSAPEAETVKITPGGGVLNTAAGSAARQESAIHPAHRKAVKRYFERKE